MIFEKKNRLLAKALVHKAKAKAKAKALHHWL